MTTPVPTMSAAPHVAHHAPFWTDRVLWALTLVFVAAIIFSIALVQVVAAALVLFWIATKAKSGERLFHATSLDYPYLAVIVARLIAIPLSVNPGASARALYVEMPFYLLFFIFTATLDLSRREVWTGLVRTFIASAVLAALIGIGKYLLGVETRATSTTAGYYTLGIYLSAALPIALLLRDEAEVFPRRWVWVLSSLVIMLGIVFTFNRLHWAGMVFTVCVVGLLRERRLLLAFVVGVVLLVVAVPPVTERFQQALHFTSYTSGRDVLWRGAAMLYDQRPLFGFGLRSFPFIFPLFDQLPDKGIGSWHNDYLQMYMEAGAFGLLALLWLVVSVLIQGGRHLRAAAAGRPGVSLPVSALLLSLVIFFLVGGVFDTLGSLLFRLLLAMFALLVTSTAGRQQEAAAHSQ